MQENPSAGDEHAPGFGPPGIETGDGGVPRCVLLVEDNAIISLDTEQMLKQLGVAVVLVANSTSEALAAIGSDVPDFAMLDVDLGEQDAFALAHHLWNLGVRFVFATGYAEDEIFPGRFVRVPRVLKPYSLEALKRALTNYSVEF